MKIDISKVEMKHKIEHEFFILNDKVYVKAVVEFDSMDDVYIMAYIDHMPPIEIPMDMLTKEVQAQIREKMLEVLDEAYGYDPITAEENREAEMAERANDDVE